MNCENVKFREVALIVLHSTMMMLVLTWRQRSMMTMLVHLRPLLWNSQATRLSTRGKQADTITVVSIYTQHLTSLQHLYQP